jgi:hypothetical protein
MGDTAFFSKVPAGNSQSGDESMIRGVSVRSWIVIMVVATICANHLAVTAATLYHAIATQNFSTVGSQTTITEPLYSIALLVIGALFGKQLAKAELAKTQPATP